jgi:hypothetical protein
MGDLTMTVHPPLSVLRPQLEEYLGVRRPDLVGSLSRAFEILEGGGRIEGTLLLEVVEAASDSHEAVSTFGAVLLGKAAEAEVAAQLSILEMLSSRLAGVRFNAILCLTENTPTSIALRVLSLALRDKSPKIRAKAAERASQLKLKAIQTELLKAVSHEKNRHAKEVMSAELGMLRDGYYLVPSDSGPMYLTVEIDGSREMHLVQDSQIRESGIERIVATLLAARRFKT